MKLYFAVLLVVMASSPAIALDDETTLTLLKSAYAEHVASWSSGKLKFTSKAEHPGKLEIDIEGELEWSPDYVYFKGERFETSSVGILPTVKRSLKILRGDGMVAALVHHAPEGQKPADMMFYFPDDDNKDDGGVMRLMPDYRWFLFSLSPIAMRDFGRLIRPDEPAENDRVIRGITVAGNNISVRNHNKKRGKDSLFGFRVDAGGLCESFKFDFLGKEGTSYDLITRVWRQTPDQRWFPEKSEVVARMNSESAVPYFHYTLTISECRPLDEPGISTTPSLTVFGPIPDGALVGTRGAGGKLVYDDVSAARDPEFEDLLKEQAKKLRGSGFGEGRQK